MAATVPPAIDDPGNLDPPTDQVDSDLDAEGEEETDLYQMDQQLQDAVHRAYHGEVTEENSDGGADGEARCADARSEQNGGDMDETEPVGAVKLPDENVSSEDEDMESGVADADADSAFEDDNDRDASNPESSESESEAEEDWEAESNGREDADVEIRSRANCM